jgi:flagellar hook-length control protein FliK
MSVNISSTQGSNSWKNNTLSSPLGGANARDASVVVDKQMATFEHLLNGISWEATDPQEASFTDDVQPDQSTESTQETDEKQESDENVQDAKGDGSAEQVAAQQAKALEIQTIQQDVKPEEASEETDAPVLEITATEEKTIAPEEKVEIQATTSAEYVETEQTDQTIVAEKIEQVESELTTETKQVEIKQAPNTERNERRHREDQGSQKNGPMVQAASQQERGPSREDQSERKEVKVEAKISDEFKPQEKLEDVRSNRRSRKERLAERAENPQSSNLNSEENTVSSAERVTAKADTTQPNPDASAPPPIEMRANQPLAAVPPPAANAPPAPSTNAVTTPENRGVDRLQGTNSTTPRSEVASERNESSNRTEQANRGEQTREKSAVDQRQQIRLIQRVARGFERLSAQGGNIRLRLHPPELGSLAMNVRVEGKTLSAEITTETVQAKQALMDNLPKLKQQLADNGLTIERFEVHVADKEANFSQSNLMGGQSRGQDAGNANQSGDWQQRSIPRRSESIRTGGLRPEVTGGASGAYRGTGYAGNRGFDVRV